MGEPVGSLYYTITVDTSDLIRSQRRAQASLDAIAGSTNRLEAQVTNVTRAIRVLAAGMALLKAAEVADEFRLLQARVNVASESIQAGAQAMDRLRDISTRTRSALADNVQVFTRLNPSIRQMGGNANDTLRIVDLLSKAITVSGATAAEKSSALIQFGQALGSGKLAGDELRSLLENAPYLMKQLAAGLGVPIGALKGLGEQAKLTADVVVNALTKAADSINRDFGQFPVTVSGAATVVADSVRRLATAFDELSGKNAILAGFLQGVATGLNTLADVLFRAGKAADDTAQKDDIQGWAQGTARAISYVADAADVTMQTLTVLGRNVAFIFSGIGREIGGRAAQIAAVLRGDFKGASGIGDMIAADSAAARKALDQADAKTLADRKLWGQAMRDELAKGVAPKVDQQSAPSKLKAQVDPEQARKDAAKLAAARAYFEQLLADTRTGLAKIDAEERKALEENTRRAAEDPKNAATFGKARSVITEKFARERALLEESYARETAATAIAITTDAEARIVATRAEAFRAADADVRLGVKTWQQGEQAKLLATFETGQRIADLREKLAQTAAETAYAAELDAIRKIDLARQEANRRADAAVKLGAITAAQAEADKARAAIDAQNAIRQQVLSINPLAALEKEYQEKLSIVQFYEQQMAQASVDGAAFVEAKRTELARQFKQQRQAIAEAEFAAQSDSNKFLIDTFNALGQTATSSIVGLIERTTTAEEAMRALGRVVLSEAVGALVQIGVQTLKNALIGEAADKAMLASKAANAAVYTTAVSAQVAVQSALAAQAAFAATAGIPIVGPALAPAAAVAAGAAAAALGAPAVAMAPIAGARQYGGPVNSDSLYRVNETGAPEMFTSANGSQYMLPTESGSITPANKVGAGGGWTINVHNAPPGTSVAVNDQARIIDIAVARAQAEFVDSVVNNSGPAMEALRAHTNVQPRL